MNSKTHVFHNIIKKKFFHEFMLTYITSVSIQHLEGFVIFYFRLVYF